jgi:hypothetical protein
LKLLAKEEEEQPDDLDCHPLVREHFGEKLKKKDMDPRQNTKGATSGDRGAWKEAHERLYEYYKSVPEKEYPDTLEGMEPLFRAVYHGCAAGKHQETLRDVYWRRISRGDEFYSTNQLGAFGSDLGAVACFFERYWDRPAAGLSEHDKAAVLNFAGFRLRAVGRLREAAEPMEASLELFVGQEDWLNVAIAANNPSEVYLTLGETEKAVEFGQMSVEYADKSGNAFERTSDRTTLADAFHQAGEIGEAKGLFEEAEEVQKNGQSGYEYLYSLPGYLYCDLLLALGEYGDVKKRAKWSIEIAKRHAWLLDIALDKLSLGRAWLAEAASKTKKQKSKSKIAEKYLNEAVDGLRKAGIQDHLPLGLLARAGYYRVAGDYEGARGDLEEVREIAERGEMKLFQADYHLEAARLCLDEGKKDNAKGHIEASRRLVEECGYHRRDGELKELERGINL